MCLGALLCALLGIMGCRAGVSLREESLRIERTMFCIHEEWTRREQKQPMKTFAHVRGFENWKYRQVVSIISYVRY